MTENGKPLGTTGKWILGAYLVLLTGILIYLLVALWPREKFIPEENKAKLVDILKSETNSSNLENKLHVVQSALQKESWSKEARFFGKKITIPYEIRLLLLVLIVGALGSFIHAATSFADYVGNRSLYVSWLAWYILRPFIGMVLAFIFYLIIRGGLFMVQINSASSESLSPVTLLGLAALAGMFSKQIIDKLRELLDVLLKLEKEPTRKNRL